MIPTGTLEYSSYAIGIYTLVLKSLLVLGVLCRTEVVARTRITCLPSPRVANVFVKAGQ